MNTDVVMRAKGKSRGKRFLSALEVVQAAGENPIKNIIRLAYKAEAIQDYSTAVRGWQTIQEYLEAKRKPVDPTESALKHKQAMTLDQLLQIKTAILAGTHAAIDETKVIDQPSPNALQVIEVQAYRLPEDFI